MQPDVLFEVCFISSLEFEQCRNEKLEGWRNPVIISSSWP